MTYNSGDHIKNDMTFNNIENTPISTIENSTELAAEPEKELVLPEGFLYVETWEYRDQHIDFMQDNEASQMIGVWKERSQVYYFGYYNPRYHHDMGTIIDDGLDTITRFPNRPDLKGSKLTYFQNGKKHRDIKLMHKDRIVKIFLVVSETLVDQNNLISESEKILTNYINLIKQ